MTSVDLLDLVEWVKQHRPELLNKVVFEAQPQAEKQARPDIMSPTERAIWEHDYDIAYGR